MTRILLIALGGAAGSVLRYGVSEAMRTYTPGTFPWGTLLVNITGCFAIGLLAALFAGPVPVREEVRLCILVGVLGGYTTFSSFSLETFTLIRDNQPGAAFLYSIGSVILGLAATWAGVQLARMV